MFSLCLFYRLQCRRRTHFLQVWYGISRQVFTRSLEPVRCSQNCCRFSSLIAFAVSSSCAAEKSVWRFVRKLSGTNTCLRVCALKTRPSQWPETQPMSHFCTFGICRTKWLARMSSTQKDAAFERLSTSYRNVFIFFSCTRLIWATTHMHS